MESPQNDIRRVVRELVETESSVDMLAAVDKYFTADATLVYPLLNSPKGSGREGVKSAYKMLRVLTYGNKINFDVVAFDRIKSIKGTEFMSGYLDLTESLKFRTVPLPERFNPTYTIHFLIRVDLRKDSDDLWRIVKQSDSLPSDYASTGIRLFPFDQQISNLIKFSTGLGTLVVGSTLSRLGWFH